MGVRYSEWVALGFFVWLVVASGFRHLPWSRRWQVVIGGSVFAAAVVAIARFGSESVRDWMPALYILVG